MNQDRLTALLKDAASREEGRSPACPDEHQIAGYVDGGLGGSEREQVERHLADCRHCLGLVGLLSRERGTVAPEPMRPELRPAPGRSPAKRRLGWWLAPQWAIAAALVLIVPLMIQIGRTPERGTEGQGRPDPAAIRAPVSDATELRVLAPEPGTVGDLRSLTFRWTAVPGAPYYDVRIVTDDGDVVIQERVSATSWRPPADVELRPGAEYFIRVDAYPAGDKAVSSDHVPFRIVE